MTEETHLTHQERDRLLYEVHQGLFGVSHNDDDNGVVGAISSIKDQLKELNGQVKTNTIFRKIGTWLSSAIVVGLISLAVRIMGG